MVASSEGGFSGAVLDPRDSTGHSFLVVTDRGPNQTADGKVFLESIAYHQKILRIRRSGPGHLLLVATDSLRLDQGAWTTGISPVWAQSTERAFGLVEGRWVPVVADSAGFDFEGLTTDGRGGLWLVDEYGPRLVHARSGSPGEWVIDRILGPGRGLPEVLRTRRGNKGFEGIARTGDGRLLLALQGSLAHAATLDPEVVAKRSRLVRLVVLDPDREGGVRQYAYLVEDTPGLGKGRIGDCLSLPDGQLVVMEVRKGKHGNSGRVDLWKIDLSEATDLGAFDPGGTAFGGQTPEEMGVATDQLALKGIQPVRKTLWKADVAAERKEAAPKAEGLVRMADGSLVVVFDDDFRGGAPFLEIP
ncbi:MAG: esterase-like activity of phytase family protein [Fibrobacteria bacterium]|nr:esterase-like activity of phytase family protein [Fibrobacteria bacterium]